MHYHNNYNLTKKGASFVLLLGSVIPLLFYFSTKTKLPKPFIDPAETNTENADVVITTLSPNSTSEESFPQSGSTLEQQSERLRSLITKNCRVHPQAGRLDWKRFGTGSNNGYVQVLQYNHPDIWWSNLAVSERLQAIYTSIQKAGSTTVLTQLSAISSPRDLGEYVLGYIFNENGRTNAYNGSLYMLGNIGSYTKARKVFDTYYKFVFFRDPLERLFSGFKDKVIGEVSGLSPWLEPKNREKIKNSSDVKEMFKKFLEFLLAQNDSSIFDQHFRPQTLIANPCEIKYDFIGFTEDISCALPYLFKKLDPSLEFETLVPKLNPSTKRHAGNPSSLNTNTMSTDTNEETNIIGEMPDLVLSVVKKHYQIDYDILGFKLPGGLIQKQKEK